MFRKITQTLLKCIFGLRSLDKNTFRSVTLEGRRKVEDGGKVSYNQENRKQVLCCLLVVFLNGKGTSMFKH